MNGENTGHQRTGPHPLCHPGERNEKQQYCDAMPKNIDQMLRTRVHPEDLAIEHMRNRSKRMPVLGMDMRERPTNPVPAQSRAHVWVVVDVKRIVIVDELMMKSLAEDRPRNRDQKNSDA